MSEENEEKTWASILVPLTLAVPLIMWRGFVFCKLWGWFFLRLGAPPVTLVEGLGVWLVVSFATVRYDGKKDQRADEKWWAVQFVRFLFPACFLLSGWIYQKFL